jgi:hypothetical protein
VRYGCGGILGVGGILGTDGAAGAGSRAGATIGGAASGRRGARGAEPAGRRRDRELGGGLSAGARAGTGPRAGSPALRGAGRGGRPGPANQPTNHPARGPPPRRPRGGRSPKIYLSPVRLSLFFEKGGPGGRVSQFFAGISGERGDVGFGSVIFEPGFREKGLFQAFEDPFGDLGDDGVPETSKAVHSRSQRLRAFLRPSSLKQVGEHVLCFLE